MHDSGRGPIRVRRVLSGTPLTRLHERSLSSTRGRGAIPWGSFQRSSYAPAALALAQDQAERLAEGEYGAVGLFGEIVSGLAMTGAPFDVVSAASTVSSDEIRHADYCVRFAEACAGDSVALTVDRDAVERACHGLDTTDEVDFFLLKYSAVGESLAAALLLECRDGASDPLARAMYASLLSDEVHHARLGWYYFAWRAPAWSQAERQRLADRIAEFVVGIEQRFWIGRDAPAGQRDMARALGVLDSERQREAIAQVMSEEITPGLDAIGLGGSHAWRVRQRGGQIRARAPSFVITGSSGKGSSGSAEQPSELRVAATGLADASPVDAAAAWLVRAIDERGHVRFGLDPLSGACEAVGLMQQGRAAIVIAALREHGAHAQVLARAVQRLERDLAAALDGTRVAGFPEEPALVAATLALAALAGLEVREALRSRASVLEHFRDQPWYAAQVAAALAEDTPEELWAIVTRDLDRSSWAPWTARAALAKGDNAVFARATQGLVESLAGLGPGGTSQEQPAPALARIAATLEALVDAPLDAAGTLALTHARDYLQRWQFRASCPPGVQPELAYGALPLSPSEWYLRTDVTAHALLALLRSES
ncbi:MAG TPA: ferritin-like domain-containing protein [Polyangiaceae bacterium]|nr:ferritin-like domain-containing protein [Polyangiaceae bacterium]